MVAAINAEFEADGVPNRESVEDNLAFVRHPSDGFDPARDILIAELRARSSRNGAELGRHQRRALSRVPRQRMRTPRLAPARYRTALLVENERRARELARIIRPAASFGSAAGKRPPVGRIALLKANSYEPVAGSST